MLHQGTFPNCTDLKYTWMCKPGIRLGKFEPTSRLSHVELNWTSFCLWKSGGLLLLLVTTFMETPRHIFGHLVVSEMCWAYFMVLKIKMNVAIWEIWLTPVRPVLESLKQESCHSCHTRASTLIWRSLEIKPPFTCLGRVYSVTQTGYLWSPCPPKNAVLKEKTKIFVSWKPMTPGS